MNLEQFIRGNPKLLQLARPMQNWLRPLYAQPITGWFEYIRLFNDWRRYRALGGIAYLKEFFPCLEDRTQETPFDAHYFYQGAWLARRISAAKIAKHVDIGSSVLTISVLSSQVETIFVDYRPLKASIPGLTSIAGNILGLPFQDDSIDSLSCLHVIEHIGLGRYGDPIDPFGSVKAALELQRIVCSGGNLFLSLPVGRERVCFNAHRVHSPISVLTLFPAMKLIEFSYVDDAGQYSEDKSVETASKLEYGCGLFHFQKS